MYRANSISGTSKYVLFEDRTDDTQVVANSILSSQLSDNIILNAGGSFTRLKSHNFKNMLDLLGGSAFYDINIFGVGDQQQSDLNNPNRMIGKGDTYGYNYNLFTINKIISYYNEFLLKVRKLVITFLNNSSIYCNTETVDIDIISKINEYYNIMTKEDGTKFKLDSEEPKIKIYKKILQNTISEFNKLYVKYFNIIKYLIFKNIKYPSDNDDISNTIIFNEIKYNYNIYNNSDRYNNFNFIKDRSIKLHCNEFINKYMKLTTKEKEYIDINIDNVSWSFIVLVIIFAIILLEPIII